MEVAGSMYRTGDIVCVSYGDFNGQPKVGVFLILYTERQDRLSRTGCSNVVCAKITTKFENLSNYSVRLRANTFGLENECAVCLNKIHTFTHDRIYKRIGSISGNKVVQIYREYKRLNNELETQLLECLDYHE